jgi:hypothetical protein
MKGGIAVKAISEPLSRPISKPIVVPASSGQTIGKSVNAGNTARGKSDTCARLADTTAAAATTEPEDRSMPLVMMTRLTPMAMMPITAICRMMICSRSGFIRKLWPLTHQPSASKNRLMPTSTRKMPSSGGHLRLAGLKVMDCAPTVALLDMVSP